MSAPASKFIDYDCIFSALNSSWEKSPKGHSKNWDPKCDILMPHLHSDMTVSGCMVFDWDPGTKILTTREVTNIGLASSVGLVPVR